MANGIPREERDESKFYEFIDIGWHLISTIMKHVITFANDTKLSQYESITEFLEKQPILETTLQSTYKSDKKDFND